MMSLDDLDGLYGPPASHSEHKRSIHIRYYLAGEADELTGMIIWVSGIATDVAGTTFSKLTLPCIIDLISLPILLVIYNTIVERRKRV